MRSHLIQKLHRQYPRLIRWSLRVALIAATISAIALLGLLVWSTGNASRFAEQNSLLLFLNGILAVSLIFWVGFLAFRLLTQIKKRQFGARLTARFTLYFTLIGILPGLIIYALSVQLMLGSIESWFNVRVDTALESGQTLGQAALDAQIAELKGQAQSMALQLDKASDAEASLLISSLRESNNIKEAMIFTGNGRLVAFSSADFGRLLPDLPPSNVMNRLRVADNYSAAEAELSSIDGPTSNNLFLRVVIPLNNSADRLGKAINLSSDSRWLQLIQDVPDRIAGSISQVNQGYRDYQELADSRDRLSHLYTVTLTLALILALFAAVVVALAVSRRLVKPLLTLASGTQAVGLGDYRPLPEPPVRDEVGILTRSFNAMTRQLDEARKMVDRHRHKLEQSNLYLESVLSNLSSGVLVFDKSFRLTLFNQGAQNILHVDLRTASGRPLETAEHAAAFAQLIRQAFAAHDAVQSTRPYWQQQFEIETSDAPDNERKKHIITILARGTKLFLAGHDDGYLVVFDDISEVISASRTVAWGEVARRLAHEIKNPLTPIQLSAERLAMKLNDHLQPNEQAMLKRSTQTIINQVDSLKNMVNDFRDYARTPTKIEDINLNELLTEVLTLYGWEPDNQGRCDDNLIIDAALADNLPNLQGDPAQLRQVIHNLLANAKDAVIQFNPENPKINLQTKLINHDDINEPNKIRLTVTDNGPGFDAALLNRVFEPYVTTKTTGTGLGLAIVKKIIEEHNAQIDISNLDSGGARITILFSKLS